MIFVDVFLRLKVVVYILYFFIDLKLGIILFFGNVRYIYKVGRGIISFLRVLFVFVLRFFVCFRRCSFYAVRVCECFGLVFCVSVLGF